MQGEPMKVLAASSTLALVVFFVCPVSGVAGAQAPLEVGAPAPKLTLRTILGSPDGSKGTWQELRGKAAVIEFWATWCGGCVESITHMNKLAEEFKSRPVQFISITDEADVELVKRFLTKHPIEGWVAFDDNETTFQRFAIEGRPQTILVDANGILRGAMQPERVTEETLEDVLAGKSLHFAAAPPPPVLGLEPQAPPPLFEVLIRPAAPVAVSEVSPGWESDYHGRYDAYGHTMREILSEIYGVAESRVDAPEWCSQSMYDFSVVRPESDQEAPWPVVQQALETAFGLKAHTEMKETHVYVLRKIAGEQPVLRTATTKSGTAHADLRRGQLEAIGYRIGVVGRTAGRVLDGEVLDETRLNGRYDFDLKWDPKQPSSIICAVRQQLNLELVMENRKLEHVVVDSITEAKTR
jgi:uncharacterized protein (TIGR03435 family)